MRISINKTKTAAIALVLVLAIASIAITFITCLPAVNAQVTGYTFPVKAYLSISPYPVIGVDQILLVNAWIVPSTARPTTSQLGYLGNYTITFTKPDVTTYAWQSTS